LFLDVGVDPVDVGGGPAVDTGVASHGTAVAPWDDTAERPVRSAGQWAAGVTLRFKDWCKLRESIKGIKSLLETFAWGHAFIEMLKMAV